MGTPSRRNIQRLGMDPDGQMVVLYAEEMHFGCAGIALALSASSLAAAGIASSGTPEQVQQWVPECFGTGDEIKMGAYAVTEPQAGSDVRSLRSTAKLDGDEWVLNGTKVFISNGGIADVHVVVATVDPELGHRGQASFVVPKGTPACARARRRRSASAPRTPRKSSSRTAACRSRTCSAAWTSSSASSSARARAVVRPRVERARDLRGHAADRRRLGAGNRAGRIRVDPRAPRQRRRRRPVRDRARRARPRASRPLSASTSSSASPTSRWRSRPRA